MDTISATSLDDWNGSYLRRLAPYVALSLVLHLAAVGVGLGLGFLFGGGRGIEVQLFEPGESTPASTTQPLIGGFFSSERMKVFRIDFFREVVPYSPPEPVAAEEASVEAPEQPPEEETVEPAESEEAQPEAEEVGEQAPEEEVPMEPVEGPEEIVEEAEAVGTPPEDEIAVEEESSALTEHPREAFLPPSASGPRRPGVGPSGPLVAQPELPGRLRWEEELPDALGIFREGSVEDADARVFPMPEWELADIEGTEWRSEQFLGNYTIYLIGDMSRRHGLEDLLAWNYVIKQLITNPQAAYPPNVATVATTIENPYAYRELRVTATLEQARDDEACFGVFLVDREGKLPLSLGYTELPQPIVIFADDRGYIRMLLIGRIRDISSPNIDAATGVIADMWRWTEQERGYLPPIVALLINVLRDTAYDEAARAAPVPDIAREKAPSWGYPLPTHEEGISPDES